MPSPQQICGEGVEFEVASPSDGSSLLVLIRQRVSDAFLDRWCVLPFDGRSDGVTCSAKQVTSDLAGVWVREEEETQSDPEEHLQHRSTSLWWFKDPLDLDGGKFSPRFWCRDVVQNEGVTLFSRPSFGKMGHTRFSVKTNVKTAPQKPSVFGGVKTT